MHGAKIVGRRTRFKSSAQGREVSGVMADERVVSSAPLPSVQSGDEGLCQWFAKLCGQRFGGTHWNRQYRLQTRLV